jgi:hypothetical protein
VRLRLAVTSCTRLGTSRSGRSFHGTDAFRGQAERCALPVILVKNNDGVAGCVKSVVSWRGPVLFAASSFCKHAPNRTELTHCERRFPSEWYFRRWLHARTNND